MGISLIFYTLFLYFSEKKLYEGLPDELTIVARKEADEILIETCTVAYVPIVGYLLMTPESVEIPASTRTLVELVRVFF